MSTKSPGNTAIPLFTVASAWESIETCGWLAGRSADTRAALRGIARLRTFDTGEYIYCAGDRPNGVFGLVKGGFDVSVPRIGGEEFTVHRANPGFWVGDLALFSGQQRLVSLRAAAACHVVHLPQDKLAKLVRHHPAMIVDFYQLSHENMATALRLLGNLSISGADNRIALRLLEQDEKLASGEDWIHISQDALAEIVALSPPSVRRAIRRLEAIELIETRYGRIRVLDRVRLADLCGDTISSVRSG